MTGRVVGETIRDETLFILQAKVLGLAWSFAFGHGYHDGHCGALPRGIVCPHDMHASEWYAFKLQVARQQLVLVLANHWSFIALAHPWHTRDRKGLVMNLCPGFVSSPAKTNTNLHHG